MSKRTDETTLAVGELVRAGAIANGHDPNEPVEFHVCGAPRGAASLRPCDLPDCDEVGISFTDYGQLLCSEHLTEWLMKEIDDESF